MSFFGIPGTEAASSNEFLGRLQFDARVGFWCFVDRVQDSTGAWGDQRSDDMKQVTFAIDFLSLEVGYLKLSSPPSFVLVPYGTMIPQQPQELGENNRKAFQPGFRAKVIGPRLFGDNAPRYFSATSKAVMGPTWALYSTYAKAPEAAEGKIPVVSVKKTDIIESKTPQGTSRFHSPVYEIVGWTDRTPELGAETVLRPGAIAASVAASVPPRVAAMQQTAMPANHVPPPAKPQAPKQAPIDDDLPF